MKKIIILMGLIFLLSLPAAKVMAESAEDASQKGAGLYLGAVSALAQKDFSLAKLKYEQAAQYLSGEMQEQAVRMAGFMEKMNSTISAKQLIKNDPNLNIIGEIKEEGRVWHIYYSKNGLSFMHVAMDGEKDIEKVIEKIGADLFTKQWVIKDTEGYLSGELSNVPDVSSRIRMWYCGRDDTTNIVYESYSGYSELLGYKKAMADEIFMKAECSPSFLKIKAGYLWFFAIMVFVLLLALLIWRLKLWQKISKKIFVLILAVLIIAAIVFVILMTSGRYVEFQPMEKSTGPYEAGATQAVAEEQKTDSTSAVKEEGEAEKKEQVQIKEEAPAQIVADKPKTEINDLGVVTASKAPQTWSVEIPDNFTKVEIAHYDKNKPDIIKKYMGWNGYLKANDKTIWQFKSWSSETGGLIFDAVLNKEVKESSGSNFWIDATSFFKAGLNSITFYHYTGGDGIGSKLKVTTSD